MDTGFFKWVWRFNALALAAIVSFTLFMLIGEFGRDLFREQRAPATVNVDPADDSLEETLEIGPTTMNETTGLIQFALLRKQNYDAGGYGSGSNKSTYDNVINLGFIEPSVGDVRWLLPDNNDGLLVDRRIISRDDGDEAKALARVILYVSKDDNDRRLSRSDTKTLMISRPDGLELTALLENVERVLNSYALDDQIEVFDLIQDGKRLLIYISVATRTVERMIELPVEG